MKDVVLGEGIPKICVPMVGETITQLIEEAKLMKSLELDLVEWRVDYFKEFLDIEKVIKALREIIKVLEDKPILFTFRSLKEGGVSEFSSEYYFELNQAMAETKLVDLIDIELFNDEKAILEVVATAHANDVAVVISNHDFKKTPAKEEIIARLCKCFELGGDIAKIAVMPTCNKDVITILDATSTMKENYDAGPIITGSMGGIGVISRLSGEIFGSALTFGAGKTASAPGQVPVAELRSILELLHKNL